MAEVFDPPKVTWYLCDLVSGRWLTRLPIVADQVVSNLAEANRATLTLNVAEDACPDEWAGLLAPAYNKMIVLCLDEQPAQGWWIDSDVEVGSENGTATLNVVTLEGCYDAANIPEVYGTYDDAQAAFLLCTLDVGADGTPTGLGGMSARFGFIHEYAFSGNTSDYNVSAAETQTIYAKLRSMMDDGLIEFRCLVRWADNTHKAFTKVMQIRKQVGSYRKDSTFTFRIGTDGRARGTIDSYTRVIGRGTTAVIGTTTVGAQENIVSAPAVATDLIAMGFPVVEKRKTYTGLDTADDVDAALAGRTASTLTSERGGVITWTFVLRPGTLLPGQDFDPGDTCGFIVDPRPKIDPIGGSGTSRLLGHILSLKDFRVTPTLWPNPTDAS